MRANTAVAGLLEEMAVYLDLDGANSFRVRAYQNAAQTVSGTFSNVSSFSQAELEALPGVGQKIAAHITEALKTGTFSELEEMRKKFPPGVLALVQIPNVGPKRARTLFDKLAIDSVAKLEAAARAGKIRKLEGFGEKTEAHILSGIATAAKTAGRTLYFTAEEEAREIISELGIKAVAAGSLRRGKETVGDIDILCAARPDGGVTEKFTRLARVEEILSAGKTKASVRLSEGLQCDLRVVEESSFGAALLYFTGSKEHNIALREHALSKGFSLNEYGLFKGEKLLASKTEEEIYKKLGLAFIPPELREGRDEISLAEKNALPKLVELKDVKGDFHNHTNRSDGSDSFAEMARAAAGQGWEWVALGDHTQSLGVAGGLSGKELLEGKAELSAMQAKFPEIKLLRSAEVEIKKDGSLDISDEDLAKLDVVAAAVHSAFQLPREEMTGRILRAAKNPHVDVIAHLTGRMIGRREGYEVDCEKLFAESPAAFEINGQPLRQDLSDAMARQAKASGAVIAVSTDAHSTSQFDYMSQAVKTARRAGLEKKDILNCLSWEELSQRLK